MTLPVRRQKWPCPSPDLLRKQPNIYKKREYYPEANDLPKIMIISTFPRFVLENQKLMFSEENNTNPFVINNKKPSVHEELINLQIQACY